MKKKKKGLLVRILNHTLPWSLLEEHFRVVNPTKKKSQEDKPPKEPIPLTPHVVGSEIVPQRFGRV